MPLDEANIEQKFETLGNKLKEIKSVLLPKADAAVEKAAKAEQVGNDAKAELDKLLTAHNVLSAEMKDKLEKIENGITTLEDDLEQRLAKRPGQPNAAVETLGQILAKSEGLKAYLEGGARGKAKIDVENAITSAGGASGLIWSDRRDEIVGIPQRQMTIRQLLMPGTTDTSLVEYAKQTLRTNAADMVAESAAKPRSDYAWGKDSTTVRTIAHLIDIPRQALDDASQLQSLVDGEMRYGLDLKEEAQLLTGDGLGENLPGLTSEATAYAAAFAPGAATYIDTLRLAMLQVALQEYAPDANVIHPTDWARIELTKDANNNYIFANPRVLSGPVMWGLPAVPTQSMTEGSFLTGNFMLAAQIFDRMDVEVLISDENTDNFEKNMYTMRAEKRLALAVKRALALVFGSFV